jgi:hypothetical protein
VRTALAALLLACAALAGAAPPELVIETELTPAHVYVGGEARLRLRLLRAPGVPHGVLRTPALGDAADTSLLGPIRVYEEERAGVLYQVLERTHVIVPRRAGRLVVPGAEFESVLRYAETFQRDPRSAAAPLAARGPEKVLQVRPVPAGAAEPWLPARRVTLEESWSRDLQALAAGSPVTRTLVLEAEGLAAERLPRLEMARHPALVVHHDQPEFFTAYLAGGMTGRRVQRIVLMPVGDGEVVVPELRVRWWDVEGDVARVATLPGRTVRLHATLAPEPAPEPPAAASPQSVLRAFAASILLASGLALWLYLRTERLREARRVLREACRRNDARGARDALVEWWKIAHPRQVPPLAQRMGDDWDAAARAQLDGLDAALYAGRPWDGKAFWRALRPWLRRRAARRERRARPALPPLFRLQARR